MSRAINSKLSEKLIYGIVKTTGANLLVNMTVFMVLPQPSLLKIARYEASVKS